MIEIVKAKRENFNDIKNVMLTALKEDPKGFSVSFEDYTNNSDFWWFSYIEPYFTGGKDVMFLAKDDSKVVGMGGILFNSQTRKKHGGLIVWMYTLKEFRRKGVAKKIMQAILEEAKNNPDIKKISLFVNSSQKEAQSLYAKFGFENSGTLKKDLKVDDEYLDTHIMELFF